MIKSNWIIATGLLVFALAGLGIIGLWLFANGKIALNPQNKRLTELGRTIYAEQCASCHGKNLEGEPNWRSHKPSGRLPAPPHDMTGHTWHHRDDLLFQLTKIGTEAVIGGDYKSDMPGFKDILNDQEIIAVLSFIKSTWPVQLQKRHDRLNQKGS